MRLLQVQVLRPESYLNPILLNNFDLVALRSRILEVMDLNLAGLSLTLNLMLRALLFDLAEDLLLKVGPGFF